jgi:hypothetical protein
VPPPARRSAALIPESTRPAIREQTGLARALEQLRRPKNLFPLVLIVVFGVSAADLLLRAAAPPPGPSPEQFLVKLTVSSSKPSTSLFGNELYLGEIGPTPRVFTVAAGQFTLRVIRSRCQASDTTLQLKAGSDVTLGPLEPHCAKR